LKLDIPKELLRAVPDGALTFKASESWLENLQSIGKAAGEAGNEMIRDSMSGMVEILLILLLAALVEAFFLDGLRKNSHYVTFAAGTAILLSVIGDVDYLIGLGEETVLKLEQFSRVLLPVLAAATASMGHAGSAAVRQISTVFAGNLLLNIMSRFFIPLIWLQLSALTAGCLLSDQRLKTIALWIKKGLGWLLGGVLSLFTIFLSVAGAIVGSTDAAAVRTAKRVVAGTVPVVGGILSTAAETVLAGAGILKNSIGLFGVLVLFALCIVPFLRLAVQYGLFKLTGFLASAVASPTLAELINGIGGSFGLVLGMVGSCAAVLLISLIASLLVVVP